MKFGVCCDYRESKYLASLGYDYIEMNLTELVQMDDSTFAQVKQTLESAGIQAEAFNCFFPGSIPLIGDAANMQAIAAHAEKGLSRAAQLGGKVAVVGSGAARRIPDGVSTAEGREQFKKVLALCGDIAKKYEMMIVIEPLNAGETNQIFTVAEGIALCKELNHPHVAVLADYYHIYKNSETLDAVKEAGSLLAHTHIARPADDRGCPAPEDEAMCAPMFAALKENGYTGRVSIEGNFADFRKQTELALPVLKKLAF